MPFDDLGRARAVSGAQGMPNRLVDHAVPFEPPTGACMQPGNFLRSHAVSQLAQQQVLEQMVVTEPAVLRIECNGKKIAFFRSLDERLAI